MARETREGGPERGQSGVHNTFVNAEADNSIPGLGTSILKERWHGDVRGKTTWNFKFVPRKKSFRMQNADEENRKFSKKPRNEVKWKDLNNRFDHGRGTYSYRAIK